MENKIEKFKKLVGDKLADLKQLFNEEIPVEMSDMKLKDGTIVRVSGGLKEGSKVMIVSETGEAPAPDGTHELENGSTIEIKGGVIVSVAQKPEEMPANMEEDMKKDVAEVKEGVKSITYKYSELEKTVTELKDSNKKELERLSKENETLKAQNKAMFSLIEGLAELPATEPTEVPAEPAKKSALQEFRESVKEMKQNRKNK